MNFFPSPPSSPTLNDDKVMCGECDKPLSSDWFCADCHKKCEFCNRFLTGMEQCSRCWVYDSYQHLYVRKTLQQQHQHQYQQPLEYNQHRSFQQYPLNEICHSSSPFCT
ncbi:hypothetical protein BCR42DRAFT_423114 [Absidia repens]|uniref:Uncharacterized protein n=1 Tax=Absidia repens TaxID=90262 RepID=A0A1X2I6X9_9FUNG|nr:hypothetical protein BCR42DRAFT_423114 [Absidia repens]